MKYEVKWTENALKSLRKLSKDVSKKSWKSWRDSRIAFSLREKTERIPLYSLRVGAYRVILSIEARNLIVFVIDVGHRKKIYRKY